ncbi:hypothetical protein HY29_02340 [Hyphomonas beringensis]|uniref:Uncharacterized protein n=1 Tax=Hyphomonas beringensis TaxID=1280946 RepID=A0A062UEP4_9PROT|nr:hypothetical protein HY29_02340 [Hyphomonas beringensis]
MGVCWLFTSCVPEIVFRHKNKNGTIGFAAQMAAIAADQAGFQSVWA